MGRCRRVGLRMPRPFMAQEPGDDAPLADQRAAFNWACLIPFLICVVMAVPYLRGPRNLGYDDWDLNLAKYESVRRTVLEWGQFPWWDPSCRGGFPLAANPQCGVVGVATPLVLALGTSVGMRVAQLVCLLIAMEGGRRLALALVSRAARGRRSRADFWNQRRSAFAGCVRLSLADVLLLVPMAALLHLSARSQRSDGVLLGFWLAFNVLNGINYYNVYALTILAVVWLARSVFARPGRGSW